MVAATVHPPPGLVRKVVQRGVAADHGAAPDEFKVVERATVPWPLAQGGMEWRPVSPSDPSPMELPALCDHTPRDDVVGHTRPCAEASVNMESVGTARNDGEGSAKRRGGSSGRLPASERGAALTAFKADEARPAGAEQDVRGKHMCVGPGPSFECAPIVVVDDLPPSAVAAGTEVRQQRLCHRACKNRATKRSMAMMGSHDRCCKRIVVRMPAVYFADGSVEGRCVRSALCDGSFDAWVRSFGACDSVPVHI